PGAKTRSVIAELDQKELQSRIFGKPKIQREVRDVKRKLQRQLARLGCYTGKIDGIWGTKSRRALSGFVGSASLPLINDRPSVKVIRLTESYSGSDCNVRRNSGYTQIARVSPDRSFKVVLTSKTDPTLQPATIPKFTTEVKKLDLSAVIPDGQNDEWLTTTRRKKKSVARKKSRVFAKAKAKAKPKSLRSSRPSRAKSWKKRTLARLLETSD
ncbi:MAG: peptidoglycan-binding domain-containing protein, partial [Desulfobulbia bacterium]